MSDASIYICHSLENTYKTQAVIVEKLVFFPESNGFHKNFKKQYFLTIT